MIKLFVTVWEKIFEVFFLTVKHHKKLTFLKHCSELHDHSLVLLPCFPKNKWYVNVPDLGHFDSKLFSAQIVLVESRCLPAT